MNKPQPIAPGTKINRQTLNRMIGAGSGANPLRFAKGKNVEAAGIIYAVVMSEIKSAPNPDSDMNNADFAAAMGTIKIEGKVYKKDENGNETNLDKAACRYLVGGSFDTGYEKLVVGTQVEVVKAGEYDNPDYDADEAAEAAENNETYDEPETLAWYVVVADSVGGVYSCTTQTNLAANGNYGSPYIIETVSENYQLRIYAPAMRNDQNIPSGSVVTASRINGKIQVIAPCPKSPDI